MKNTLKTPVISIDVEGWAQSTIDPNLPITKIAEKNTYYLLELFDELEIKTTMFVLGKFAKNFPEVVKAIYNAGHEVASHGYGHIEAFKQTPEEFDTDIKTAKDLLENIIGEQIYGYRAPCFSIIKKNLWALDIVAKNGYTYDSSIFPIENSRYGIKNFPRNPIKIQLENNKELIEFPIASLELAGKRFPIAGGGYHRLLPSIFITSAAKKILKKDEFVYYCHPYEFNGDELNQLDFEIPLKTKIHQGLGRGKIFTERFSIFAKKFGSKRFIDLYNELIDLPLLKKEQI